MKISERRYLLGALTLGILGSVLAVLSIVVYLGLVPTGSIYDLNGTPATTIGVYAALLYVGAIAFSILGAEEA